MAVVSEHSVVAALAALHAERERTWEPAQLQSNIDQRRRLVNATRGRRWVQTGDVVEPFKLEEVDGGALRLDDLLESGPIVLIFFRFAGCPACNTALPVYNRRLAAAVRSLSATLVAVSPQLPERLVEIKRRHGLNFPVATDRDNALGRKLGITFEPDEASKAAALAKGNFIGEITGTGTWELPMPTVLIVGRDQRVRFAEVSPDWMVRTEPELIIAALRELTLAAAA